MILTLTRHAYLQDCTLGWLLAGSLKLATIERPWIPSPHGRGGKLRESCVPDALYHLRPHESQKFPDSYALTNSAVGVFYQSAPSMAWGRTAILIHPGNTVRDVIGCIAVGLSHSRLADQHSVLRSRDAMNDLRAVLGRQEHQLLIQPTPGTQEVVA